MLPAKTIELRVNPGGPLTRMPLMQFQAAKDLADYPAPPQTTDDYATFYALYMISMNDSASSFTMSGPTTVELPSP